MGGVGERRGVARVVLRTALFVVLELLLYALVVFGLLWAVSLAINAFPAPGITTTPETRVINSVPLSLQSLKHIIFEAPRRCA